MTASRCRESRWPAGISLVRRGLVPAAMLLVVILLAACGTATSSGSGQAQSLLKQTFSGPHIVKSGVLGFSLTLTPSGSSTVQGPISIALGGPFQSRGTGKLPASDLNLSIDALGHHGQLGVISTGTTGYLTLDGAAYRLPPADFQKLASSFAGATGASGTGGLSTLGINPLHWLQNPAVVGQANVGGAPTTHIHARVNVSALLGDLSTFLQKASSSAAAGGALPGVLTPASRQKIAGEVRNAAVDVWTGTSDKTLRKLSVGLSFPVSGQYATLLGGVNSAAVALTVQYADLNQPQTIAAPTNVQPFSGFTTKLTGIIAQIRSALGTGASAGSGSSTGSATGGNSATIGRYSKCLQKAGSDVAKMQKCASLLNGG